MLASLQEKSSVAKDWNEIYTVDLADCEKWKYRHKNTTESHSGIVRVERYDTLNPPAHLVLPHKHSTILGEGPPPLMVPFFFPFALTSSTQIHLFQAKAVVLIYLVKEDI